MKPFKECSCGETFKTEQDYFTKTTPCGIIEYERFNLNLRNCINCKSTLTTSREGKEKGPDDGERK
jgi:hypothetical protein